MSIRVRITQSPTTKNLRDIKNGVFFTGKINGYCFPGPFLKIGSVSEQRWLVIRVEDPGGAVWSSSRAKDFGSYVDDYAELNVKAIWLLDHLDEAQPAATVVAEDLPANPSEPTP